MTTIRPREGATRPDRRSDAIGIARVLCVLGVVYVHGWTGLAGNRLATLDDSAQGQLRWALIELLGHNAVPLLGMISGFLVAGSLARRPTGPFYAGKARTILAPMLLWNAIAILLVSGAALLGILQAPVPHSGWWLANELTAFASPNDIDVQMPFLRDLFLCMIAAPLLVRLPSAALIAIAATAAVWAVVLPVGLPILLRPQILMFVTLGMLVRRHGLAPRLAERPIVATAALFLACAAVCIALNTVFADVAARHEMAVAAFDLAMRVVAAWLFWSIAWRVAASRARDAVLAVEPYAFLLFCAHLVMIWLGGPLLGHLTGPMGSRFYPLYLLVQPALVLAATIGLGRLLIRMAPRAAELLSGGAAERVRPDPAGAWRGARGRGSSFARGGPRLSRSFAARLGVNAQPPAAAGFASAPVSEGGGGSWGNCQ